MRNFKQAIIKFWQINWLRRITITFCVILLFLVLLPVAIQYSITNFLLKQGATQAEIHDIELNLFTGQLELIKLNVTTQQNHPLQLQKLFVDINMLELFTSKIVLDSIQLSGLNAQIYRDHDGTITISGLQLPAQEQQPSEKSASDQSSTQPIAFGINRLTLESINILYAESGFTQQHTIEHLQLTDIRSWEPESLAKLSLTAKINQAPLSIETTLVLFSDRKQINGKISLSSFDLNPYEKFYQQYLNHLNGEIILNSQFEVAINSEPGSPFIVLDLDNEVSISKLDLDYQGINQTIKEVQWQGSTNYQSDGQTKVSGNLRVLNSQTKDLKKKYKVAAFERLSMEGIQTDLKHHQVKGFNMEKIQVIESPENLDFFSLEKLQLSQIQFDTTASDLKVEEISFSAPEARVTLNGNKQIIQLTPLLNTLARFKPENKDSDKIATANKAESSEFNFYISKIQLHKPGLIHFTDTSVSPNYSSRFHINSIDITPVSSINPATFTASIQQGDYTKFVISGNALLLNPAEQLIADISIQQLDLPPVTSYTSQAMGYGMKSGVVDTDIQLKLAQRGIDSHIKLKIDSIEVVETNSETAEQISSASGMSIDLALSTLKDKHNVIELELPISGNIDKPDFDLSKIINKAMGKAMQSASLAYLKHALQPFGSLLTLYDLAKSAAGHISLPPIGFQPNSTELGAEQNEILTKVKKILVERPTLKIKACAITTKPDRDTVEQELIAVETRKIENRFKSNSSKDATDQLAEAIKGINIDEKEILQRTISLSDQRAALVKSALVNNSSITPNRILNCLSSFHPDKKMQPSVELHL